MKTKLSIQQYMTPAPVMVEENLSLREARWAMRENRIRHLPVTKDGHLVGILSDRDIKTAGTYLGSDADNLRVRNAMTPEPFTVSPDTGIEDVVALMAKNKYGCAIVRDKSHKVVGIFTLVDAMNLLAAVLHTSHVNPADLPKHVGDVGYDAEP